ncbi:MAG: alpha/beta hydrolase [Phototrophicaceae bacterium]
MPQPLIHLGGDANLPAMTLAPANGFVPELYVPILEPFMNDYHVISTPPRALWGDGAPPEITSDYTWRNIAEDMLTAYQQFGLHDVVAIGHSIGAVTTLLAAIQQPDLFKAIILLDPVVIPKVACDWMREQRQKGEILNPKMVAGALRRRNKFQSIDVAFEHFHGKSIFADWSDEMLRLYVTHGTIPCEDNLRCLKWSPQWEAFYFGTYFADIWDYLPKLNDLTLPILFVSGGTSDTFVASTVQDVAELIPQATYESVAGHGHLFPQSAPDATHAIINDWLTTHIS